MIRISFILILMFVAAPASAQSPTKASVTPGDSTLHDPGPLLPPWASRAALKERDIERLRPKGIDDLAEALPGAALRVAGDRGFPSYFDLAPVDGASVEILYDGVPTRSPADLDPGIWDLSATGIGHADRVVLGGAGVMGGSAILLERDPAVWISSNAQAGPSVPVPRTS